MALSFSKVTAYVKIACPYRPAAYLAACFSECATPSYVENEISCGVVLHM